MKRDLKKIISEMTLEEKRDFVQERIFGTRKKSSGWEFRL